MPETFSLQLIKRGGFFRLTALQFLVHDWLALLLWACGEAMHHGGDAPKNKPAHLRARGKRKGGERDLGPTVTFEHKLPIT